MPLDKSRDHPSLFLGRGFAQLKDTGRAAPRAYRDTGRRDLFLFCTCKTHKAEDTLGRSTFVCAPSSCLVLAVGRLISSTGLVMSRDRCCLTVDLWPIPFMVLKAEPASGLL
jgi:hypothetical protein